LPASTTLSGTTAQLTTGIETSGYLNVSGAVTLAGLTKAAAISGSGQLQMVGLTTLGGALHVSGNVGLGTDSPSRPLHIYGAGTQRILVESSDNQAGIELKSDSTDGVIIYTPNASDGLSFNIGGTTVVEFGAGGTISGSSTLQVTGDSILGSGVNVSGTAYFADKVGVGVVAPKVPMDIHTDPSLLVNDTGGGEVGKFGLGTTTAGKLYYLHSGSAGWLEVDATIPESGSNHMIAIALGSSPASDGMLLRGFFDFHTYLTGAFVTGQTVYVADSGGRIATYQPSGSGNIVRIAGHATNTGNVIYFNPSTDWIEV
jgi:hypothetical protein